MALTIDELNIQIEANSKNATKALTALIKKLEKLNTVLSGSNVSNITITNSFNKTTNAINKTTTATKKHDEATKNSTKNTKSFTDRLAQNISKWRTLYSVFQNAANTMSEWFTSSNDYVETLNLFNVTMGDAAGSAKKFADSVSEAMGIDVAEWMDYQGTFKQLTSGFGIVEDKANIMSKNLTQLSYDLASFFNTDVETAFDKLSSAMAGQVKGLREFGIDTTVASLQEYALAQGIDKSVRSMTQAEKSMLRYNYIMENSIKIQGDMARTIATPANAIRILTALLTQMKRALGNIVSVIVVKFIPYVQALVQIVTEAANAIANFLGYKLPEIDYSGLGSGFADEFEDAEDSVGGVEDGIKAIKKQLMGFDELNIISNPDTSSSGAGSGEGAGGPLDMKPIEYNFLEGLDTSKAKEIYNTLKKMLTPMKRVWGYLVDYQDTIKTIAVVIAGLALVKKIKTLATTLAGFNLVNTFLNGFSLIKTMGGNFFQSFVGGLDSIRYSLSTVQKVGITAAAALIGFVTIKDSVKSLALGCEDVGAKMVTITVALGGMGVAMYTALGPWGLLLAAIVAVTGALVGVEQANQEMMSQMVADAFYDGMGIKITDLANSFKDLADKIIDTNQPILDNKATIEEARDAIDDAKESIETLIKAHERGIISTEDFSTQVNEKFSELRGNVKTTMDAIYNNIIYALSTSLGDAIEQAGGSVQEYLTIIGKIKSDGDTLYTSLVEKQNELNLKFMDGKIYASEYATGIRDINEKMSALSGSTSIVGTFSDKMEGLRNTVNWENEDARKNAFETINTSASDAKSSVNEACDEIKRNLETMKLWTNDQTAIAAIDELLLGNEESRKTQLEEIDAAVNTMYDNLQADILAGIDTVAAEAQAKWDSMNGWQRFWSGAGTESAYVAKAIQTYRKDYVAPISEDIESSMDELGTAGSVWATDAVDKIMNNAFDYSASGGGVYVSGYSKSLGEDVKGMLEEAGKDATSGFDKGVLESISGIEDAFSEMAQRAIDAVKETQDSHSPAKEYISLAKDAIDGYTKGVEDNFHYISDAFEDGFESVFEDISKQAKSMFSTDTWSGYAKNITNALANVKTPQFKNIGLSVSFDTWVSTDKEKVYKALGLSGFPRLSWYTYANGGFPSMGEMFIAREAGPELVGSIGNKTAVANNDQIVSGIEAGVYRAMMAANSGNRGGTQTIRIVNEIDGSVVGEKVIQYHNGKVIQTGVSPLMI